MPELPEVESLRRSLIPRIVGQKILTVSVLKPKLVSGKGNKRAELVDKKREFENGLRNETIVAVRRRAKNLVLELSSGKRVLIHLKMTGQLVYQEDKQPLIVGGHPIQLSEVRLPHKHTHIIFCLQHGRLYYNDTRMFGYLLYYPNPDIFSQANHFQSLGKEPDDPSFSAEYVYARLHASKRQLKSILMDQNVVVGLGNIYADEVCFAANVRPTRVANSLTNKEVRQLYAAIQRILQRAIELGGSSIADYLLADGSRGNFAREHQVYGRAGLACVICGNTLKRIVVHGRTTVFCSSCQK